MEGVARAYHDRGRASLSRLKDVDNFRIKWGVGFRRNLPLPHGPFRPNLYGTNVCGADEEKLVSPIACHVVVPHPPKPGLLKIAGDLRRAPEGKSRDYLTSRIEDDAFSRRAPYSYGNGRRHVVSSREHKRNGAPLYVRS